MEDAVRICIVGAGSSYTPELVAGILEHNTDDLPVAAINLYDIDEKRLNIMAGLAGRMIKQAGREIEVTTGTDLAPLLAGVRFVITQMRVGGMQARYLDESIPLKYGIIGQETTGPGGMFKALRTIRPMLKVADTVAAEAPDAFILNYTNPSGIISEAVFRHSKAKLIGLCSGIPGLQAQLEGRLGKMYPDLKMYSVGLNHLGFIYRFLSAGKDVSDEVINNLCGVGLATGDNASFAGAELIRILRAVPIAYCRYFFQRGARIKEAKTQEKTRAQVIMDIEKKVLEQAAEPDRVTKPEALDKRGGGGYSNITFGVMQAILHDTGAELACTVQNRGAVNGIEDAAGVEIMARINKDGAVPVPVGDIPIAFRGVVQAVKAYETLTIEAAMTGSRDLAVRALLNHPLVGDLDIAEPLVDEMIKAHGLDLR